MVDLCGSPRVILGQNGLVASARHDPEMTDFSLASLDRLCLILGVQPTRKPVMCFLRGLVVPLHRAFSWAGLTGLAWPRSYADHLHFPRSSSRYIHAAPDLGSVSMKVPSSGTIPREGTARAPLMCESQQQMAGLP